MVAADVGNDWNLCGNTVYLCNTDLWELAQAYGLNIYVSDIIYCAHTCACMHTFDGVYPEYTFEAVEMHYTFEAVVTLCAYTRMNA